MATHTALTPPQHTHADTDETPEQKALKQAFAIVNKLKPRLQQVGLSADDLWDYVKQAHQIQSRTELTEPQRVVFAARLAAAERDTRLFHAFCAEIRKHKIKKLKNNERLFDVTQRQNKPLVDITLWHSEILASKCIANIEKMTVRGQKADLRRIGAYITHKDVNHMTTEMLKNAILDYIRNTTELDLQNKTTRQAISDILQQHTGWMHLNDIRAALKTDRQEEILEILRSFYRQTLIEHNPYGSGLWFRWKHTR